MGTFLAVFSFMLFLFSILGVIIFLTFRYVKYLSAKTTICWTGVADRFGLEFSRDAERKDPLIAGSVDGVEIKVSQTFQTKRVYRAESSHMQHTAGTIVEAPVENLPLYWVVPRTKKSSKAPDGMTSSSHGSKEFQEKYELFLPESDPQPPCEKVQGILLKSTAPLSLIEGKAVWWSSGIVRDQEKLEQGVLACVALAKELKARSGKDSLHSTL